MTELLPYKLADVATLIPYANNARTHSDEQIAQIAASIREFGFINPVVVDGANGIIAGHGRVLAARKLGLLEVPCIEASTLTDTQRTAYVLADNALATNASWNDAILRVELKKLDDDGFDLSLVGFDDAQILGWLSEENSGLVDPEETPNALAEDDAITNPGDVWVLGKHRIVCGDCTDALVVEKCLNGVTPTLMVTDPPYGVQYDPTRTSRNAAKSGKVLNDDRADWREAWSLFPGDVAYVWHASLFTATVLQSLEACDFVHRSMIIWAKDRFTLGRGDYQWQHEPCWYVVRKGAVGHWNGDRSQSTVWNIKSREDGGHGHGTQKPVECMRRPIENNSSPGQAVYEPFSGSGTTIIACEQTGRRCHAIELSRAYVDVAVKRWQEFTGKHAVRESDGVEFDALSRDAA